MAYPDYSVVIISVTENGVTNDYAQSFFNDELAKKHYNQAISEGKRAFYYEKPTPTRFVRNDSQPLKVNDEKGLEALPIAAGGVEQKIGEVAEDIRRWTLPIMVANAFGVQEQLDSGLFKTGEQLYGIWKGFNNMLRRAIIGTTYTPYGQVIFQVTVSNKRVTFRADGNGEFIVPPEIEKIWPNKDEITWTPPLNVAGIPRNVTIEGTEVYIGTERQKKVHDGTQFGGVVTTEVVWVAAGGIIHETETKTYRSDGNGWYTSTDKAGSNCDPVGTVISSTFLQDLTYPISIDSSTEYTALIGQQYSQEQADGECGTQVVAVNTYSPSGSVVYETETTYYKSNGNGGVYEEAKDNGGGGGDGGDGGDGGGECLPSGYLLGYTYESMPNVTEVFETASFSYSQGFIKKDLIADGACGTTTSEEGTIEYNDEGLFLGNHFANGQDYIATAGPNGSVVFSAYSTPADGSDGDEELDNTVTNEDYEFPEPPSEPCPPANYGDGLTTSVLKSNPSGNIVGTLSKREIVVVLPEGYYNTGTMGLNGSMPSNTKTFTTGRKWSGRFIADGNCGWVPEPAGPRQWTFPEGTSFPAGDYTNLVTVSTSGGSGTWTIWKDDGMLPNNAGRKFTRQNCGFRSDGKGNVTCFFK